MAAARHHRVMKNVDLKTLQLLVAVCDHGNIKRAAEQEHIEPSAISKRIAQLEHALGTPLLVRERRGVTPTPAGLTVLEHARSMLFTMDRMENDVASFSAGAKGHVLMLASASAIAESLLDDVAAFMREPGHRNIKVDIEERYSRDLVRELRAGVGSVGVCWASVDLQGLQHRPYRSDQLAVAVHADHPLAGRRTLRFDQTLDHEHVGLPPSAAVHAMLQRAAARAGRTLTYRVIVSNFDAAFRVVAAKLGISVIPAEVGSSYARLHGIKVIPLSDAWARRRFVVCFRDFDSLQPAAQKMVEHLEARARAEGAPR
jgi:DNA-binding transcriptional LysR family regulator